MPAVAQRENKPAVQLIYEAESKVHFAGKNAASLTLVFPRRGVYHVACMTRRRTRGLYSEGLANVTLAGPANSLYKSPRPAIGRRCACTN